MAPATAPGVTAHPAPGVTARPASTAPAPTTPAAVARPLHQFIPHPRADRVLNRLAAALSSDEKKVVVVIGPSGVGKTALLHLNPDRWFHPAAGVADPPAFVHMAAPSLYGRQSASKAFLEHVVYSLQPPPGPSDGERPFNYSRARVIDLVHEALHRLETLRPLALVVDDAQHLAPAKDLEQLLDAIRHLAVHSNTHVVLAGTYGLLPLIDASSEQLRRRIVVAHFRRYMREPEDFEIFRRCIRTIEARLPFPGPSNLVARAHVSYLQEHTLGCVGTLSTWLRDASRVALAVNPSAQLLTLADLQRCEPLDTRSAAELLERYKRIEEMLSDWMRAPAPASAVIPFRNVRRKK